MQSNHFIINTDGGARGNPGPAATGVVIQQNDQVVNEFGDYIGETTNNVAEYTAVIKALEWIAGNLNKPDAKIILDFYLDSSLVVNQLNGLFKVKDANLRKLLTEIRIKEQGINADIFYHLIPREKNSSADFQVNQALDKTLSSQ